MSTKKGKGQMIEEDSMIPLVADLEKTPLINTWFKIVDTECEFDLQELHNWAK